MNRITIVFVVLALAGFGCSKSKCEKYGDMELKCGGLSDNDEGRAMRLGFVKVCESSSSESSLKAAADMLKKHAECADKFGDCASYKKCVDEVK
jgi:hypothetical protein